jgi:hypothetical protein
MRLDSGVMYLRIYEKNAEFGGRKMLCSASSDFYELISGCKAVYMRLSAEK